MRQGRGGCDLNDLVSAYDLGMKSEVWVNRGHEPKNPFYEDTEIRDIGGLA